MEQLTIEQYREYLVNRIRMLSQFISGCETDEAPAVDLYLKAYAIMDELMRELFVIDNAEDMTD